MENKQYDSNSFSCWLYYADEFVLEHTRSKHKFVWLTVNLHSFKDTAFILVQRGGFQPLNELICPHQAMTSPWELSAWR